MEEAGVGWGAERASWGARGHVPRGWGCSEDLPLPGAGQPGGQGQGGRQFYHRYLNNFIQRQENSKAEAETGKLTQISEARGARGRS